MAVTDILMSNVKVTLVLFLILGETLGLDCYSCTSSPNSACVSSIRCAVGEVCSNVVFRRYQLGVTHTKGCEDRSLCLSLQDLNEDRYCSTVPSECTYCCDSDSCNTAPSALLPSWSTLSALVFAQLLTFLLTS